VQSKQNDWIARACPLCGSDDESRVYAESNIEFAALDGFAFASRKDPEYMHYRLIECGTCGILYGNPVLSPATLVREYTEAHFSSSTEARFAALTYGFHLRVIAEQLPDLNGAIDIGAGDGAFLEQLMHLGFENICGIEPSEAPIRAASSSVRPLIRPGLFQAKDFEPESQSLVTCFQTLEHLWDPLETASAARSLLKRGGAFVGVVHNRKSLSAWCLGMKSPIFDVEHLQLFCPSACMALLERAGFINIRVSSIWNRYPLAYWLKLLPIPKAVKPLLLSMVGRSGLGNFPVALPAGNLICVGFKP